MERLTYFDGGKWRLKIGDTEYINRKSLIENLNHFAPEAYTRAVDLMISKEPAVDVVEVTRCKDCIYYSHNECFSDEFWCALYGDDIGLHYVPDPDFYCAYGERRNKK